MARSLTGAIYRLKHISASSREKKTLVPEHADDDMQIMPGSSLFDWRSVPLHFLNTQRVFFVVIGFCSSPEPEPN